MKHTKRIAYLFLALLFLLPTGLLSACGEEAAPTTTVELMTETEEKTEEAKKDVIPDQLHAADVENLSKATDTMTKEELRQVAIDYFKLQLSFRWLPSTDILDFPTTYSTTFKKNPKTLLSTGIYGGIPYQSLGSGNLYRWLEYYDEDTATFDFEKMFAENGGYGEGAAITDVKKDESGNVTYKKYHSFMALFNQCSASSFGGWSRVINSASFGWTNAMTVRNGFIPVGLYDYGYEYNGTYYGPERIDFFGDETEDNPLGHDTTDVIRGWNAKNGENGMFSCYAQMKPGDLVVSPGHVMMIGQVFLITKNDGTIDYSRSIATVLEQVEGWNEERVISGKKYLQQGRTAKNYTFSELQKEGYIPFTFAEFLDENDPQDKKHLDYYNNMKEKLSVAESRYTAFEFTKDELDAMSGIAIEETKTFTTVSADKKSITVEELKGFAVGSNYAISDVFVVVKDKDGKELLKNIHRTPQLYIFEVNTEAGLSTWETDADGNRLTLMNGIEALANGENTVEITVQLWNGEKPTVYSGTLTK